MLLLVVDETTEDVFYVCLNDYINKILVPERGDYSHQDSWTVYVPLFNRLDRNTPEFSCIRLLAKRPKLYGAFSTFAYQAHELRYAVESIVDEPPETIEALRQSALGTLLRVFVETDLRLSIWGTTGIGFWYPLRKVQEMLLRVERVLRGDELASSDDLLALAMRAFELAGGLGRIYEELCREWRLPTSLAAAVIRAEAADLVELDLGAGI